MRSVMPSPTLARVPRPVKESESPGPPRALVRRPPSATLPGPPDRTMTPQQVAHFQTLGFLQCRQLFSPPEMRALSDAFDAAMTRARGGAPAPGPGDPRQQVAAFFDLDPEAFYPLLDDERLVSAFETLMGDDFLLLESEALLHTEGSRWHHDARAPTGLFSMRAAILPGPAGARRRLPGHHSRQPFPGVRGGADAHAARLRRGRLRRPAPRPGREPGGDAGAPLAPQRAGRRDLHEPQGLPRRPDREAGGAGPSTSIASRTRRRSATASTSTG